MKIIYNQKGFVLMETMMVAVFIVGIFTFLYISVIPLLGKYESLIQENDLDIVYKLYHLRKMVYLDDKDSILNSNNGIITCNSLSNTTNVDKCNKLIEFMELDDYQFVYVKNSSSTLNSDINNELINYINKNGNMNNTMYLIDINNHQLAHMNYNL